MASENGLYDFTVTFLNKLRTFMSKENENTDSKAIYNIKSNNTLPDYFELDEISYFCESNVSTNTRETGSNRLRKFLSSASSSFSSPIRKKKSAKSGRSKVDSNNVYPTNRNTCQCCGDMGTALRTPHTPPETVNSSLVSNIYAEKRTPQQKPFVKKTKNEKNSSRLFLKKLSPLKAKKTKQELWSANISKPMLLTKEEQKCLDPRLRNEEFCFSPKRFSELKSVRKTPDSCKTSSFSIHSKQESPYSARSDFSYKFSIQPELDFPKTPSNCILHQNKEPFFCESKDGRGQSIVNALNDGIFITPDISKNNKLQKLSSQIKSQYCMLNEMEKSGIKQ